MEPGNYDFIIYQGATFAPTITWKDVNGNILNLSGYTAAMQIRQSASTPDPPVVSLTSGSGITLGSTSPNISIVITASATQDILINNGVYDLFLTDGSGNVTKLLWGKVFVVPSVTHS